MPRTDVDAKQEQRSSSQAEAGEFTDRATGLIKLLGRIIEEERKPCR